MASGNSLNWLYLTLIAKVAADIPQVGRTVPAGCKRVMDALQARSQHDPYISYSDYEQLCAEQDIGEEDTVPELAALYAAILNELGYCIHYADDSALNNVVILKPDWLSKAISFVLEDAETVRNNGLVTHARLNVLWHDPARPADERYPPALHPLFLRLMERFDLSYRVQLEGRPPTSLIAQLVPDQRPEPFAAAWPGYPVGHPAGHPADTLGSMPTGESQRTRVCRIVDGESGDAVSVPGIFYRLIVRLHRFSLGRDDYERSIHWQNGLLLDHDYNGRAFVEQVRAGIRVTVCAAYPEGFLHYICDEVKWLIDNGWKGLDCQIMVPCPDHDCTGLFEMAELVAWRQRGYGEYRCHRCGAWQQIDTLLAAPAPAPVQRVMHQEIMRNLNQIQQSVTTGFAMTTAQLTAQTRTILSRIDERYHQLMIALVDEAREGPRLFSITPASGSNFGSNVSSRDRWATTRIRLTLWCEHSRLPVPLLSGDDEQGVYIIERPREWLVQIAPYARVAAGVLSLVLPVAAAATVNADTFTTFENDLELSQAAFDAMMGAGQAGGEWLTHDDGLDAPSKPTPGKSTGTRRLSPNTHDVFLQEGAKEYGDLNRLVGAPLRELQTLLKELDPTFGGLERVQNNRREFLWVHRDYRRVYDPGYPEFPEY
ncbi:MAG: COR domain-containing protein [Chloroflexota bacterium]